MVHLLLILHRKPVEPDKIIELLEMSKLLILSTGISIILKWIKLHSVWLNNLLSSILIIREIVSLWMDMLDGIRKIG